MESQDKRKYAVLSCFREDDPAVSGYLRICSSDEKGDYGIYNVVPSANLATRFSKYNYDMKPGFFSPERIAEFMICEEELKGWIFKADYIDGFQPKEEEYVREDFA